eukprot:GGOE01019446.1.p1 GENE.GGOE01019446.1~~GGOE01019446.1.p1  ORF type:complete len:467 (+),score=160.80 GGOE01019446.1:45-1403(+)
MASPKMVPKQPDHELAFSTPTSIMGPIPEDDTHCYSGRPLVIVTVGLPARGKTYLAHKLCRYCNWIGIQSKVFIAANYIRSLHGESNSKKFDASFYADANQEALRIRDAALTKTVYDVRDFVNGCARGSLAIIDSQMVSESRRNGVHEQLRQFMDEDRIIYLEIMMDDDLVEELVRLKARTSPEYEGYDPEEAECDFKKRIEEYRQVYKTVTESRNYIKVINGVKHELNGIRGYLPSKIMNWVLNIRAGRYHHPIYFSRHGQSAYNLEDRIGGDPDLTEKGREDAHRLALFLRSLPHSKDQIEVWTSKLKRTIQTAAEIEAEGYMMRRWEALNEIHAGICEHLTYSDVREQYSFIEELRKKDKYGFRYPEGESYQDLVNRLERVILALERFDRPVMVVAHQAILRCMFAYFDDESAEDSVNWNVPHRTAWRYLTWGHGASRLERIPLDDFHD